MGLKYYEEFNVKIPRDEVIEISNIVSDCSEDVFASTVKVLTCGSFRRGRLDSGDVDMLLTTKDPKGEHKNILMTLVRALERVGFLKERLGADRVA